MKYIYSTSCDPLNEGENTQQVPGNMKGEGFIAGGCHLGKKGSGGYWVYLVGDLKRTYPLECTCSAVSRFWIIILSKNRKIQKPMPLKTMFGKHVGVAIAKPASVCSSAIPTFCVGKRAYVQPIAESNIIICNCKRYSSVLSLQWKTTSNAGWKTQKGQEVMTLASLIAVVAAARSANVFASEPQT